MPIEVGYHQRINEAPAHHVILRNLLATYRPFIKIFYLISLASGLVGIMRVAYT